jgi:hypothetical protein
MLGNGDGTFGPRREFPVGLQTQDIVAGDFNNDSRLDLILTINDPATSLSLLLGNGDGSFQPPDAIVVGSSTNEIAVGDFDRDGFKDLALASSSPSR